MTRPGTDSMDLIDRRLLFVTGKGGVGKTAVSAALGALAASRGKHTLVCEVDAKGNLADFFEAEPTEFNARELAPDLFAMSMSTEESLREYLKLQLRIPLLARIGPLARSFDFVAQAAPGVKEILTVGKLAYEVKEENWDLVIVDSSATGHIVGQLAAPDAINELVQVGRVRDQTEWMSQILADPDKTGAVVVSAPEEMPVNETLELVESIRTDTNVSIAAVVVNRVLPELFGRGEEEVFQLLHDPAVMAALDEAAGGRVDDVLAGAELAVTLRRARAGHLTRLQQGLPAGTDMLLLPYLFTREHGVRATHQLRDALADELGY